MGDDGRAFWERTASRYDLSMGLFGGPLASMLPMVAEEVRGLGRVLELAAGTGLVTAAIAPVVGELVATDYAEGMVAQLDTRMQSLGFGNVRTRVLDVYALDDEGVYDAVVAANVAHLLPDLGRAVRLMRRAIRPGGRLIMPTYCHGQSAVARGVSSLLGLAGFPGQRRLTLDHLADVLVEHDLEPRRRALLPGLLPIGFVSGSVPLRQPVCGIVEGADGDGVDPQGGSP